MIKKICLKAGKEKPLKNRHHWIFSGAIAEMPSFMPGEILQVESYQGELLGFAYFNKKSSIIGRMVSFGEPAEIAIEKSIMSAIHLRKSFFDHNTTAYRLINGEGDSLPGLIVDVYADVLVIQISTLGMELLKPLILTILNRELQVQSIFEKSLSSARKEEGLAPIQQIIQGNITDKIHVLEHGLQFMVDPINGQKTGFFLDQREMRQLIKENALGKRVLNCFSYTGGFSIYALAGGAIQADSVDISEAAIENAQINCLLNGFDLAKARFHVTDVFEFLRCQKLNYDLVILDPPAFAKKAKDVINACRGYKEINREAIKNMPAGSTLVTCSCSYFIDEKLFQQVVFQAASEAKRNVRILGKHRQAYDHPTNLFHPEGAYLKSLMLFIE